ncbi:uncharacterized protein [Paramormyrops kingsleyae]|uniref:uncharacterized protein isoform X1 n=1 Tax=Paramormyrops kingsleyae TaxID=1676925 RepID=UPI003B970C9B
MGESAFLLTFQLHLNMCMDLLLKRTTCEITNLVRSRFARFHGDTSSKEAESRWLSEKLKGLERHSQLPDVDQPVLVDRTEKSLDTDEEGCYLLDFQTRLHSCMNCILKDIAAEITTWVKDNVTHFHGEAAAKDCEMQNVSAEHRLQDKRFGVEVDSGESATNHQPIAYDYGEVESYNNDKGLAQEKAAIEIRQVPEAACFVVAEPSVDYELTVATTAIEVQPHGAEKGEGELEGLDPDHHPYPDSWPAEGAGESSVPPEGGALKAAVPLQQALELGSGQGETGLHSCVQCGRSFGKEWVLRRHMRKHSEGGGAEAAATGHACPNCGRTFKQRKGLVSHLHSHSGQKPYACDVCHLHFTRPESVSKHRRLHSGVRPYGCPRCPRRFFRSDGLKSHMRTHDGGERERERHGVTAAPKLCMCTHCGKAFSSVSQVASHERTHTGERPYECQQCHKRFRHAGALSVHRVTHQRERPHPCPQCPKTFRCSKHLKRHLVTHSDARPFSCDQCPLAFRTAGELKGHKVRHGLQRTHGCPECGKHFKTEYEVKLHRRAHSGERPYRCPDCERAFRRPHHLASHRLTHTGERPYACDVCQRRFIRAREMRSHRRRVHLAAEPSKCDRCQAHFDNLPLLEAHKRSVHGALLESSDPQLDGLSRFPKILPRSVAPGCEPDPGVRPGMVSTDEQQGAKFLSPVVFVLADQGVSFPVLQPGTVLTPLTTVLKLPQAPTPLKMQIEVTPKTQSGKVTRRAALKAQFPVDPPVTCSSAKPLASVLPGASKAKRSSTKAQA